MSEGPDNGHGEVFVSDEQYPAHATHTRMRLVADKIEEHGEVHASFEGVEQEVELRLGTTKVDFGAETFEVWDGDHYQTFPAEHLTKAYKPMEVLH
jgi:hypothetical protein